MRQVYVIGIGAGNPEHVTMQAVGALNRLDVVLLIDKGSERGDLNALRRDILDRYVRPDRSYRTVEIEETPRPRGDDPGYAAGVAAWRAARRSRYEAALADLGEDETAGFLVWGDPSLYDGTLAILAEISTVPFDVHAVPGITAVSALSAAHRVPINQVGESVAITTGRRVAHGLPDAENVVVMLDGGEAWRDLPDDLLIWWGAFLGTPDEVTVAGRLGDCRRELADVHGRARAAKGWMFDTYLLRRRGATDGA